MADGEVLVDEEAKGVTVTMAGYDVPDTQCGCDEVIGHIIDGEVHGVMGSARRKVRSHCLVAIEHDEMRMTLRPH